LRVRSDMLSLRRTTRGTIPEGKLAPELLRRSRSRSLARLRSWCDNPKMVMKW